jgi:CHAT domain-containing protein
LLSEAGEIPRLPYTRREADAIASLAPRGTTKSLLDFDANRDTATGGDLSKYRYIHFATHGVLNNSHPEISGVLLSMVDSDGSGRNGFLTTHDVFNLKLRAELVVLSSCKSGLGKNVTGEGMVGLTRGFMYAGAARVLVSLWDVNDQATAELMAKFYKGIFERHLSPAAALRDAQLSMAQSSKWREPFYWAGFVLQGEPK